MRDKDLSKHDGHHSNRIVDPDLFYRSLFKYNPDMVMFMDIEGVIAKANSSLVDSLGYTQKDIELNYLEDIVAPQEALSVKELFEQAIAGQTPFTATKFNHKDGVHVDVTLNLLPAIINERVIGVFGIAKDMTKLKQMETDLEESELKFQSFAVGSLIGAYIVRDDGNVTYGNQKFYEILGLTDAQASINLKKYIHPADLPEIDMIGRWTTTDKAGKTHNYRIIRDDGTIRDVESHAEKIYLHNKPHMVCTIQDITERKRAAELNEYLAYHDYLTELPNQRFFRKKLEEELQKRTALQQPLTVMMLDLDRFKYVNDSLGHSIGDQLLKAVAERLQSHLHPDEFLAKAGGDEFTILLRDTENENRVIRSAKTLIESLEDPFYIGPYELHITASIGISSFPDDGEDAETLFKHADSALYKAKSQGKNTYRLFNSSMNTEAYKIFSLENDLRKAIDTNQLELYYQPQISAESNEIIGAEALIRWNHPQWGLVYPDEFLSLAEETGQIRAIGRWVKKTACLQNKSWQDAGLAAIPVSINLSAHRFLEKNLVENIKKTLEETNLDPKYLQIEIVESYILKNEEMVSSVLEELKKMGMKVLLDDFGTGYSSLSYLRQFKGKIDTLKIDRSFINDLSRTDEENANFLTKTIIELAQHLDMDVIAEGVETEEHLEILREYNCNKFQGYLFSKPVAADDFASLLQKKNNRP